MGVHKSVGREYVMQIAFRGGLATKPALWPRMLAIIAIAFRIVFSALTFSQLVSIRWRSTWNVGIHVPHNAVAFVVGTPESVPQITIIDPSMPLDDVMQGHFQRVAGLVVDLVVVSVGNLGNANEADQ